MRLVEAMAARLPVVATAVGDIALIVAEENRPFIVARDDQRSLVTALRRLCEHQDLRRRLGLANRVRVEQRFSIPPMIDGFHRLLVGAAKSGRRSARH